MRISVCGFCPPPGMNLRVKLDQPQYFVELDVSVLALRAANPRCVPIDVEPKKSAAGTVCR